MQATGKMFLAPIPKVFLKPRPPISTQKTEQFQQWIQELAQVSKLPRSLLVTVAPTVFCPLGAASTGIRSLHLEEPNSYPEEITRLVAAGPDAMPLLLKYLDNTTPTKRTLRAVGFALFNRDRPRNQSEVAEIIQQERILFPANRLNPIEWKWYGLLSALDRHRRNTIPEYTLTIGDICFVIIGQIVGRAYTSAPGAGGYIEVGSPVRNARCREVLEFVWGSPNPHRRLLDSLLIDYCSRGSQKEGASEDEYTRGFVQIAAVQRLLYYFEKECAPMVAARLRSLDVRKRKVLDDYIKREAQNATDTARFIASVTWCSHPEIQRVLASIAQRTDDSEIKEALKKVKIKG